MHRIENELQESLAQVRGVPVIPMYALIDKCSTAKVVPSSVKVERIDLSRHFLMLYQPVKALRLCLNQEYFVNAARRFKISPF